MAKNSGKKGDKKGAYAFEDLIGFPKMPNLGAMLNPFPSLEPLGSLTQTSRLLSDSIIPRKTLKTFSAVSKLNDTITAHGTAMRGLAGGSAAKIASSMVSDPFSNLKGLIGAFAPAGSLSISGINSILLPSLSNNQLTNRLFPSIPPMPQLASLVSSFSSTTAALRAIEDSFKSLTQMQDRIDGAPLAFSTAMQPFMQSSSVLSKHISEFQRTVGSVRRTAEALQTFADGLRFPRSMATAELLSSSIRTAQDLIGSEFLLQDNIIRESWHTDSESELTGFLLQFLNLPASAIKWLLTNKTIRWSCLTILLSLFANYIWDQYKTYPVSSISEQTVAFRNEKLPDNPLGRINYGKHTLYRHPSKFSEPVREVSENQKIILHDEEFNGWRKVSVAVEDNEGWLVWEGWIEEQGYDAIP